MLLQRFEKLRVNSAIHIIVCQIIMDEHFHLSFRLVLVRVWLDIDTDTAGVMIHE
jgi:hypothetical protein